MEKMKLKKIVSFCLSGGNITPGKHCTLLFKPRGEIRDNLLERLGETVRYSELVIVENAKVSCVILSLEAGNRHLYRGTSRPHITLEVKEGGKPVDSNELILEAPALEEYSHLSFEEMTIFDLRGTLSAMYYSSEGKQYSTSREDWE